MKKLKKIVFGINLLLISGLFVAGCSTGDSSDPDPIDTFKLTGVSIPGIISVTLNSDITITGQGFAVGDKLVFTSSTNSSSKYDFPVSNVTSTGVTINIGSAISSGTYNIKAVRGTKEISFGTTVVSIQAISNIPDVSGKNIKGIIYCNGKGIPNVVVSDGIEVTKTNSDGIYYLASAKKHGYVFISIPPNYEVATKNKLPLFFGYLTNSTAVVDQRDFELSEVDNTNHIVIAMADIHLANRNNDITQFKNGFYSEVYSYANQLKTSGTKVYGIALGDMSWDQYWYENSYSLSNYVNEIDGIGFQIFNIMGNHDNDPYQTTDFPAESTFKKVIGPSYYSFNIGKVHYVVLDDIQYINTGGSSGVIGSRDYSDAIDAEQMNWLKKDLAEITDKSTPVIVAMHIPLYLASVNSSGQQVNSISLSNGTELKTALNEFTNVTFITGHAHINYNVEISSNMYEHNIAAVCATWWWTGKTGYANNHICKDGSPGGYGVFEVSDKNIKYYYKGIGYNKNKQIRTYDRNTIEISAANFTPNASDTYKAMVPAYAGEYNLQNKDNIVIINVFNYDSSCKLEVTENGTALPVTRKYKKDPLHIISYEMLRLNNNAEPTSSFVTDNSSHIFEVTATSATSTLAIKLTDRYGNVYSESMTRPKEFKTSME
ncbi:MAG: calcineurin-like phosphoesterase family protein [Bacteroidales bacterium]